MTADCVTNPFCQIPLKEGLKINSKTYVNEEGKKIQHRNWELEIGVDQASVYLFVCKEEKTCR